MPVGQRQKKIWIAGGVALAVAIAVGMASGLLINQGRDYIPMAAILVLLALLIGGALFACIPWWRRLDDMARDAHLTAWYWGASFGGGVGLVALAALKGVKSDLFQGGALIFSVQVAAYVVLWLAWWALRRPKAS
jgi:Na+/glutamate symporter